MLPVLALLAATYAHPEQLVETDWVAAHAADANVRIVDMRQAGYADGHVPGAVYVSPVAIRDAKAPPTFLPTAAAFEEMMGKLGVGNATRVVVYDERGGIYAARLWWILAYFGHSNVSLMNGGWLKWAAERRPTTSSAPPPAVAGTFTPRPHPELVALTRRTGRSELYLIFSRPIRNPDQPIGFSRSAGQIQLDHRLVLIRDLQSQCRRKARLPHDELPKLSRLDGDREDPRLPAIEFAAGRFPRWKPLPE